MRKISALILAKGESRRLPKKNILLFHNKPMFLHNLDKCLGLFDKVYVSSDSDDILDWADSRGAFAIKRPTELCGDTPNIPVYKHAVMFMEDTDAIVAVQANSPTVLPIIIKEIKESLEKYSEAITVHENGKIYGSVWGITLDKLYTYKDTFSYYNPTPEYVVKDDSVDIHNIADFNMALNQI